MKTYLVPTKQNAANLVAVEASNKNEAYKKVNNIYPARKTGIIISSCHIDFCSGKKVK